MRIKEPEERGECSKNKLAAAKHCEKAERITDPLCHGLPNMIFVLSRRNERCGKYPLKDRICVFARRSLRLFSIFPIILRAQLLFHFRLLGEDRVHLIVQIFYHNFSF